MSAQRKSVLVAGATGLVGNAALNHFLANSDLDVIAISRRMPETSSTRPFTHIAADLRDTVACRAALRGCGPVERVVYAALFEKPGLIAGWRDDDQMATNRAMLDNLLAAIDRTLLRHVTLLQGTKAYAVHLRQIPIPARERAPRDPHPNFYWLQEDLVRDVSAREGWSWTVFRPQLILGGGYGVAMGIPIILGVYGALCRELGMPFAFPGGPFPNVWEATDSRLLARAIDWAGTSGAARNEAFNITNGEVFAWLDLWPTIAAALGVAPAPPSELSLAEFLPAQSDVWDRIVARHALRPLKLDELLGESHHIADSCFGFGADMPMPPSHVSTVKLHRAGFREVMDVEESFTHWLTDLAERRIIPHPDS